MLCLPPCKRRFGLRQPTVGSGPYNRNAFTWEDGSTKPALNPSGQNYEGAGYSHWGLWARGTADPEPNNAQASNQQCVASTDYHYEFAYYSGAFTSTARRNPANYIKESNESLNVWGWNDRACTESYVYICEFEGEQLVASNAETAIFATWCFAACGCMAQATEVKGDGTTNVANPALPATYSSQFRFTLPST
jgi:hypothetical protein